jgi:hypothetical protein
VDGALANPAEPTGIILDSGGSRSRWSETSLVAWKRVGPGTHVVKVQMRADRSHSGDDFHELYLAHWGLLVERAPV